jgi:hypothetical protein
MRNGNKKIKKSNHYYSIFAEIYLTDLNHVLPTNASKTIQGQGTTTLTVA